MDVAEIKENITTCGIALSKIVRGQRLKIGKVVQLSITKPCEPCSRLDEIRMGLQKELMGQRGMLATVVVGGMISGVVGGIDSYQLCGKISKLSAVSQSVFTCLVRPIVPSLA